MSDLVDGELLFAVDYWIPEADRVFAVDGWVVSGVGAVFAVFDYRGLWSEGFHGVSLFRFSSHHVEKDLFLIFDQGDEFGCFHSGLVESGIVGGAGIVQQDDERFCGFDG